MWRKLSLLSDGDGSWLKGKKDKHDHWRIGCCACAMAGVESKFADFRIDSLSKFIVQQHAHTEQHRASLAKLCGTPFKEKEMAPPQKHWELVLDAIALGGSFKKGVDSVGTQSKIRRMIWCLAESMPDGDRMFLKRLASLTLMRDESKGKLVIRYIASDMEANVRRGHLGVISNFGTGAHSIVAALKDACLQFFTPGLGAPARTDGGQVDTGKFDKEGYQHMLNKVEFLVADSASDENLAGKMSKHGSAKEGIAPLFPNVKHLAWDKSHGARRRAGPRHATA